MLDDPAVISGEYVTVPKHGWQRWRVVVLAGLLVVLAGAVMVAMR